MKKKHIKITVCICIVIIIMLFAGIFIMTGTNKDEQVKLGKATLPTVSMTFNNQKVNTLFGYADEMEIPFVRDTITPVMEDGKVSISVENASEEGLEVSYEIVSPDGETVISKGNGTDSGKGHYILDLKKSLSEDLEGREAVLKITLVQNEKSIYYYTRITAHNEINVDKCLDFAMKFQSNTFDKKHKDEVAKYLEPDYEKTNDTFENVDIHSNIYHVTWGNMAPQIQGEVYWNIIETNSVYTSFVSQYQVSVEDEDKGTEIFNIKEYYRVRFLKDKIYLLNFDRSMEQIFDPTLNVLSKDGIIIGIASPHMEYDGSSSGRYTAFVQERELWLYDKKDKELTCVFSFLNKSDSDIRNKNDNHSVKIIDVDKTGNVAFLVSGYMNRGQNEGNTGIAVCYYNNEENIVEEKAFMKDSRQGHLAAENLGQMIYYSPKTDIINYVLDNTLYSLKPGKKKADIMLENIPENEYVISDDGHLFACKSGDAEVVKLFNFNSEEVTEIKAPEGKVIKPLGFIKDDIIYGIADTNDMVELDTSKKALPINKIEIRDKKNTVVKEYSSKGMIITGAVIEDNLITVLRASKDGDIYKTEKEDYISNNEEVKSKKVKPDVFSTDFQEKQVFLNFEEAHPEKQPKTKYPEVNFSKNIIETASENKTSEKEYYVYGKGLPPHMYKDPSEAIDKAGKIAGVVVDENQKYIWEKGNRDLSFFNHVDYFPTDENKTPLERCEEALLSFPGTKTRLNNIEFSDLCYIICQGSPAIAKVGEDQYVFITGYNLNNIEYIIPETGELTYEPIKTMEDKLKANGNMFAVNL